MFQMFLRAGLIAILSMLVSVAVTFAVTTLRGSAISGSGLLLTTICPLMIAFPMSFHSLFQKRRLRIALDRLRLAHEELANAHAALSEKSRRDPMTGLLTREAFFESFDELPPTASGGLLVAALRNTRSINERFGFLAGDEAILQMADAVHRACGGADLMARLSDNEIAVYLAETDHPRLLAARNRVHGEISRASLSSDDDDIPLVVAVATTMKAQGTNVEALLRRVDQRLLDAALPSAELEQPIAA